MYLTILILGHITGEKLKKKNSGPTRRHLEEDGGTKHLAINLLFQNDPYIFRFDDS